MASSYMTQNARPSTSLDITVSAKGLKNRDILSKSDPICVLFQLEGRLIGQPQWREKCRTEVIQNCLDPEWSNRLKIDYFFEERQQIKFEVYDVDDTSSDLSHHDFLGRVECDLAEVVNAPDGIFNASLTCDSVPLGLRGKCGMLSISADEADDGSKEIIQMNISGRGLDKKDFLGKSDPFLNIYRVREDGSRQLAHRTEVIKRTLNPDWKVIEVNSKALCGSNRDGSIIFDCYDHDFDGGSESHDFIGVCETTLHRLLDRTDKELPLINPKKQAKKGAKYKNSGVLHFNAIHIYREHSFLDFIQGGTQLDFAVAVDFTASNGAVHDPSSLHYINPSIPNQYEVAMRACLDICQHYNHSKRFDTFGFGAKNPQGAGALSIFNLNLGQNPSVIGVQGVMEVYRNSLHRFQLYGPTNFAPVIGEVAKHAAVIPRDGSRYQVLLIITDGVISDMAKTKQAIVSASTLPLSIIIVGVGEESFDAMDELDSDNQLLSAGGRTAARDIVQFVPMRNFLSPYSREPETDRVMGLLAKEVLAEIPAQLTGYMKMHKIEPRPSDHPFPRDQPPEASAPDTSLGFNILAGTSSPQKYPSIPAQPCFGAAPPPPYSPYPPSYPAQAPMYPSQQQSFDQSHGPNQAYASTYIPYPPGAPYPPNDAFKNMSLQ